MYKCKNGQVPGYISDLIPPIVSEIFHYPLRNRANLSSVRTRTETFKMSCMPSSVLLWNSLNDDVKYAPSFVTFHDPLRCWLVGCFGFNGPLRQYFSLYRAVSQRKGKREKKG